MRYLPILAIALCLLMPIGYAISYDGGAVLEDGEVSAQTLSIGVYSRDGDEYTPCVVGVTPVTVTKGNNNRYTLSETDTEIVSGYYLKVSGEPASCTLGCSVDMTTDISSVSITIKTDGSSSYPRTISTGTYYPISITLTASYNGTTYPSLDFSPVFTVTSVSEGEFHQVQTTALRLKIVNASSVLEVIEDANEELVDAGDYDVSTNTSTNHGNNYPAVNLANEDNPNGGISDPSGQIDLDLIIPKGYDFVLYLRTSGSNTFHMIMMKGSTIVIEGTVTFNSGIGTSGYYLSSYSYDGSSSGYFYSSINNVNRYDAWMSGDVDDYSIVITTEDGQSASTSLKMDIVFKKD